MSATTVQRDPATAYHDPVGAVVAMLATDVRRGLTDEDARARLMCHGRNELTTEKPIPA